MGVIFTKLDEMSPIYLVVLMELRRGKGRNGVEVGEFVFSDFVTNIVHHHRFDHIIIILMR